jgi:hypothetical protein
LVEKALGIPVTGPYTVKKDYLAARERRGSKGVREDRYAAEARVIPKLGAIEISKLTAKHNRDWHEAVAYAPKLVRTKKFATERATRPVGAKDPEEVAPLAMRRSHGRHRGATRAFRYAHDGKALRALVAKLCRRDGSCRSTGARNCGPNERRAAQKAGVK